MFRRATRISFLGRSAALAAILVLAFSVPALAGSESGYKSCNPNSHVYSKAVWKTSYYPWLDITADGTREFYADDINGGTWEVDYANAYRSVAEHGSVVTWINSAYYKIYGQTLDTWSSWPGCEAD